MSKPKAILFDIGGVCVVSPMQAIVDYEVKNGIPKDYINFAIARSSPNGAWQRLERGEIKMDDQFFDWFRRDLHNPRHWEEYHLYFKHNRNKKSLKQLAGAQATQLGDPISLKAETSSTNPTPDEAGAPPTETGKKRRSFKEMANRSMLGDPVSLKPETSERSPLPDDSGAGSSRPAALRPASKPNSKKDSYAKNMLGDPTSLKNEGSSTDPLPDQQDTGYVKGDQVLPAGSAPVGSVSSPAGSSSSNSLKESYSRNMLGDPTSLLNEKVEEGTSSTSPRPKDKSASPISSGSSLKDSYSKNMLGDPTSLKNEGSASYPVPGADQATGYAKHGDSPAAGKLATSHSLSTSSSPSLQESFKRNPLGDPTSLKNEGSSSEPLPTQQDTGLSKEEGNASGPLQAGVPPLPTIDSTALFWDMMARSRAPDPYMYPALAALRRSQQFVVAALSNTVIFPPDHEYSKTTSHDIQSQFDLFVSSAEIGLRKPDPKIYQLTLDRLDRYDRGNGGDGIRADQVVFFDDIGSNLKAAREFGFRTIKVNIGKVDEAVRELERITGLTLLSAGSSKL